MLFLLKKSLNSSSEFSVSFLSAEVILPVHLTTTGLFGRLTSVHFNLQGTVSLLL